MIRLPLVLLFSAAAVLGGRLRRAGPPQRRDGPDGDRADAERGQREPRRVLGTAAGRSTGQIFALFVIAVAAAEVGHRSRDRDLALPQPRVDQRGRGEPPQVVGRAGVRGRRRPSSATAGAHLVRRSTPGSWCCCRSSRRRSSLFFGKRTPGKGAVVGIAAVAAAFVFSLGVLWHFVEGGGPYEARHRVVHGRAAAPGARHPRRRAHRRHARRRHGGLALRARLLARLHARRRALHLVLRGAVAVHRRDAHASSSSNNLIQLLVGWEIMGVCSYLLDRPLVGGQGELERRDQGVHHHPGRRRPVHVRHLHADRRSPASTTTNITRDLPRASRASVSRRRCSSRWRPSCCSAARSASRPSSRCTCGCPTRWPAPRRCRP